MFPTAQRVHVAQVLAVLQAERDARHRAGDLARYEGLAVQRAFVVEEVAVAGIHAVGRAVTGLAGHAGDLCNVLSCAHGDRNSVLEVWLGGFKTEVQHPGYWTAVGG